MPKNTFRFMNKQETREKCIKSYAYFCTLMQDDGWMDDSHVKLCNWIQERWENYCKTNLDTDLKLCVVLPRGALKSTIVTKHFPIWLTLHDSNYRFLISTNTISNAMKKIEDIRGVYDAHNLFRALFPELIPKNSSKWTNSAACINRTMTLPECTFECSGMKTKKTGTHYNGIIEDDTLAPEETDMDKEMIAPSLDQIEHAIGWHKAATPLLVPKGKRFRFIVTTRWGDEDLINHITKNEHYEMFNLPAKAEDGTLNFTTLYSEEKLADIAAQVGPYMFSALYLNIPLDASLRTFKSEWFHYVPRTELRDKEGTPYPGYYTIALDPAISEKDAACETAITKAFHFSIDTKNYQYWDKVIVGHYNPMETINHLLDMAIGVIDELKCCIIETVAYQAALKYIFRDELAKRSLKIDLVEFNSRTAKDVRIQGLVPYFATDRIWLNPELSPKVESQLRQYPYGKLVDIIDCYAMHRHYSKGEKFIVEKKTKEQVNPLTWGSVLDSIRKKYLNRTNPGVLATITKDQDLELGIPTGLGLDFDLQQLKNIRN